MFETVDKNYAWFKDNLKELCKKYDSRFIVIKDCAVVGDYTDFTSAFSDMLNSGEEAGSYIIQLCTEDISKTTATYHTHVIMPSVEARA